MDSCDDDSLEGFMTGRANNDCIVPDVDTDEAENTPARPEAPGPYQWTAREDFSPEIPQHNLELNQNQNVAFVAVRKQETHAACEHPIQKPVPLTHSGEFCSTIECAACSFLTVNRFEQVPSEKPGDVLNYAVARTRSTWRGVVADVPVSDTSGDQQTEAVTAEALYQETD